VFVRWFGLFLIVTGLAIRWVAIVTLGKYFAVDVSIRSDHKVITTGVYRFVRHPAYSGTILSFLGLGLSFSSWISTLVIVLPIVVAFVYRIRIEERALAGFLGNEYVRYCTTTKRMIPGLY
jgi:protein-S-isoprenylcysteine O-methyltransferase Ste14